MLFNNAKSGRSCIGTVISSAELKLLWIHLFVSKYLTCLSRTYLLKPRVVQFVSVTKHTGVYL